MGYTSSSIHDLATAKQMGTVLIATAMISRSVFVIESRERKFGVTLMKNTVRTSILIALFILAAVSSATAIDVGDKAPDFELNSSKGGKLKLSDLRGKNVLINFYRNDFDPT
jgi:peroxiredoxin